MHNNSSAWRRFGKPPQCYLNKVEVCSYNGLCKRCRWLDHIGPVSNGLGNRCGFHTRCFETVCGPWECIVYVGDFMPMDGRLSPTLEPRNNETS
jgi:hypothetical protein